jgi:hypothetical protein
LVPFFDGTEGDAGSGIFFENDIALAGNIEHLRQLGSGEDGRPTHAQPIGAGLTAFLLGGPLVLLGPLVKLAVVHIAIVAKQLPRDLFPAYHVMHSLL